MNGRELHWLTTISVVRHIQTLLPRSINIKGPLAPLVNHLKRNMVFVQSRTWDKGVPIIFYVVVTFYVVNEYTSASRQ